MFVMPESLQLRVRILYNLSKSVNPISPKTPGEALVGNFALVKPFEVRREPVIVAPKPGLPALTGRDLGVYCTRV